MADASADNDWILELETDESLVPRAAWSAAEDERLLAAPVNRSSRGCNWHTIARDYTDGRSAFAVKHRYFRLTRKPWSADEDRRLKRAVEAEPMPDNIDWSRVADGVWTRPRKRCYERWTQYIDPKLKHGRWTDEENKTLMEHCLEYGRQFTRYAPLLPGRSLMAIKNRWILLHGKRSNFKCVCNKYINYKQHVGVGIREPDAESSSRLGGVSEPAAEIQ
jgi:hypothetical protein